MKKPPYRLFDGYAMICGLPTIIEKLGDA